MARLKKVQLKLLLVFAAALLVLSACAVLLLLHFLGGKPGSDTAVIYSKGGQQLFLQTERETVALRAKESKRQVFSDAGGVLFYDAVTEEGTALYVCDLENAKARKEGGALVSKAVDALWATDATGRYAVFCEGKRLLCYDREQGESHELTTGIETLYAAPGLPAVLFTKMEGQQRLLFRCAWGQQPERVAVGLQEAHFYAGGAEALLLYLARATDGTVTLEALGMRGGVREIAQNPVEVLFEQYTVGGNLYYLEKGQETAGVSVVLEDPLQSADAQLQEPRREDYWNGLLSSYLGDRAYEQAVREYAAKLERDELRAGIKRALQVLPNQVSRQDCYVYDGMEARKLASGVAKESLVCAREQGRPALSYEKTNVVAQTGTRTVTLSEMLLLWHEGGETAVAAHLSKLASLSTESAGLHLAQMAASGATEMQLAQDLRETARTYAFPPGCELLLCREKDTVGEKENLYAYDLTEYGISERRLVDSGVTDLLPVPVAGGVPGAYYSKQEAGAEQISLYFYEGTQPKKLVPGVNGYFYAQGQTLLLAISGVQDQQCTLWLCRGGAAWKTADGVQMGSIHTADARAYYIAQPTNGSGSLYACQHGQKPRLLDTEVTEIVAVR
ncbi:MAG: hypothetical protein LBS96_03365 [Oscillospiraceae bacterium]|jgi:hypothetical protein|nr:hypothetical protein [Oscillospiraceae bacterium]